MIGSVTTSVVLLSVTIMVSGLTAAVADPLKDDLGAIREYCEGEPFKKCLAKFKAEMAGNQGYQEAAFEVCPRMVVTDQQLRDLRNKKYRSTPDFASFYKDVKTRYAAQDFIGQEIICVTAVGDVPLHPKAYQKTWLKIEWKEEDRAPLVSKEALAEKAKAFQTGYHDGNCQDPCKYSGEVFLDRIERDLYQRGKEAGQIDRYRAKRTVSSGSP